MGRLPEFKNIGKSALNLDCSYLYFRVILSKHRGEKNIFEPLCLSAFVVKCHKYNTYNHKDTNKKGEL